MPEDNRYYRYHKKSLLNVIELLIEYVGKIVKYGKTGWIDVKSLSPDDFKTIHLELEGKNVICKSENKIVPIKVKRAGKTYEDEVSYAREYFVDYVGVKEGSLLNPLPVSIKKKYGENSSDNIEILPDDFEGFIVCSGKEKKALLIPKKSEKIEFINTPWKVRVHIKDYADPLVKYGRKYKIILLDNVDVIKNGKREFFWPLEPNSLVDVYDFQRAIKNQERGLPCHLYQLYTTHEIVLRCHKWKKSYSQILGNLIFVAGVGTHMLTGSAYLMSPLISNVEVKTLDLADARVNILVDKNQMVGENNVIGLDGFQTGAHMEKLKNGYLYKHMASILMIFWLLTNVGWLGHKAYRIKKCFDTAKRDLDNLPFAYPWSLSYTEDYTLDYKVTVDNALLRK